MAAGVFNVAKGRIMHYVATAQAGTGGAVLRAALLSANEAEGTLIDRTDLANITAQAGNTEATFTGYTANGQAMTGPTVTIDNGADDVTADVADVQWSPTSAETLTKIIILFDSTGSDTAANLIPLFHDDFAITTPTSGTVTYQVAAGGFVTSS